MPFKTRIIEFFASIGGKANSMFGEITLDKSGVDNSMGHGMSRLKSIAFASIKDVLEQGIEILPLAHYNVHGKKQLTGAIAAPIYINGERYICVVEVIKKLKWN